jgi:hypothetical protein
MTGWFLEGVRGLGFVLEVDILVLGFVAGGGLGRTRARKLQAVGAGGGDDPGSVGSALLPGLW